MVVAVVVVVGVVVSVVGFVVVDAVVDTWILYREQINQQFYNDVVSAISLALQSNIKSLKL